MSLESFPIQPTVHRVVAGTNVTVDNTNPTNPVISVASGSAGINQLTGDVTAGPGNGSVVATLASVGSASTTGDGAHVAQITTDTKGRVSSALAVAIALPASAITSGTLPVARGGTNSATALSNNRVMQSSGGAIVEAAAITAARALISDANGIPTQSATTSTELGFVSGVTSAIQTQFRLKANLNLTINTQGGNYTLVLTDGSNTYVRINSGSPSVLTIPPNASVAFAIGTQIPLRQVGAGQVQVAGGAGVTVNFSSSLFFRAQGSTASIIKVGPDEWDLAGDMQ